jgi:hypothetical protein
MSPEIACTIVKTNGLKSKSHYILHRQKCQHPSLEVTRAFQTIGTTPSGDFDGKTSGISSIEKLWKGLYGSGSFCGQSFPRLVGLQSTMKWRIVCDIK